MNGKSVTKKSLLFLFISLLVTLAMFLLDPLATATNEALTVPIVVFIVAGTIISLLLAIVTLRSGKEKKLIPLVALVITIFNVSVISFFLYFGANFA
ncbi:hypothetical protein [Evansella clarkii]|jgi:cytochrome bd-type quinol oxidase subunit 2|uniref:hypothetical protein n=1 Tax=Evansella clarkii TaxID=79879 RepID=UPI000996F18F|nr:hypothetical protein [Evansella clarkii]